MQPEFAQLIANRRSVRAYTKARVDRVTVERICAAARRAPSGANLQPGSFHVLTGRSLSALTAELTQAADEDRPVDAEYSYFPDPMPPDLKDRQRKAGYALYEALGITRRNIAGRRAQFARNYAFFGAPVGVVVTIRRDLGKGGFMDLGMAVMTFLMAAESHGLGATGIGALANYGRLVHRHLGLPEHEMVVCGIALGHPDRQAPVNLFRTEREPLEHFTSFRGFEDEDGA
ncbi:nitroreductase [Leisingera daeponensis]|uniref:nitroreductase n=1 Tax=Leisingera daeponensis TaxID=405746 RepID=UPI001C970F74|nr:nitroreductase [Leisingera daeponensis]MBY6059411.1 nitroreductase [Leisingera daeponensis]